MLAYLQRLQDERDSLTATATSITDQAATDGRDVSETEAASLATMATRCAEIDGQLTTYAGQADSTRAYAALRSQLHELDTSEPPAAIATRTATIETPSWGDLCERSGAWSQFNGHGTSERVDVGSVLETRAVITTADNVFPKTVIPAPGVPQFPAPISGLVTTVRVSSGTVAYVYAQPIPPGDAPVVAEGALKPEMVFSLVETEKTLATYAHYKAITRQALDDIPQIRSLVESYLRRGLISAVESAIAAVIGAAVGTGTAVDAAGLINAIRKGVGVVQAAGWSPNGILLNPADWAAIDLAVLAGTMGGPTVNNSAWGLRIVASTKVTAGTAWVGAFDEAVTYFDRGVTNVYLTDSHSDFFLRNQLVLLGETRGLPAVVNATALCKCTTA